MDEDYGKATDVINDVWKENGVDFFKNEGLIRFIEAKTGAEYNKKWDYYHINDEDWSPSMLRKEEILSMAIEYLDSLGLYIVVRPFIYGDYRDYRVSYMKREGDKIKTSSIKMEIYKTREEALLVGIKYIFDNKENL